MARSVVLMSGGIASATLAALAADEGEAVWLFADYGQRNAARESSAVEALAGHFQPARVVRISMPHWKELGEFALLARADRLPDALAIRETPDVCYIPGLLPSLACAGLCLAATVRAEHVMIGLIEDRGVSDLPTRKLFPDHSRESIAAWNWQFQIASDHADRAVQLEAPLIASRQADMALLAHRLGVPFERTWSCYRNGPAPCRRCYGCAARGHGFLHLGLADPLAAAETASR